MPISSATKDRIERGLNAHARRQHGLITRAQALDAGLSPDQIKRRVQRGLWVRVRHRVYRSAATPPSELGDVLAACLSAGPEFVACRQTAAGLHALDGARCAGRIHLLGPRRIALEDVESHLTDRLPSADRRSVAGVPVTSVARTLVDLSTALSEAQLERMIDDALRRGLMGLRSLASCIDRLDGRGRRPTRALKAILAQRQHDAGDSVLEVRAVRALRAAGLPRPVQQHTVTVRGARYRLDLAWPAHRIAVEVDGWFAHNQFRDFHGDRKRDLALASIGWRVVRFTARTPDAALVSAVQTMLDQTSTYAATG